MIRVIQALLFSTLFIAFSSLGQTEKVSAVEKYIESKGHFVRLNDPNKIPKSIQPYLESVKTYMAANHLELNQYWVSTIDIKEDSANISIPVYHYDGFERIKELEEEYKEAKKNAKDGVITVTDLMGNASGKDGHIEIVKSTKKVFRFSIWV